MADQVHGTRVVDVGVDAPWPVVGTGDVIVTQPTQPTQPRPIAVWAADCAPLVLFGGEGTVVGAHAGWRGLAAGVVDVAVGVLAQRGESVVAAVAGPMIHGECYAFGDADLAVVAAGVRVDAADVTASTADDRPALDVPAALTAALADHGITLDGLGGCTACDPGWFSHRARVDPERHVLVAWTEPARVVR
jgi:copper oxidase (laccase) domain-containing protein